MQVDGDCYLVFQFSNLQNILGQLGPSGRTVEVV